MAVLAVPVKQPFEVAPDKTELFESRSNKKSGKEILQSKLEKCNKGDIKWDSKK